MRAFAAAMILAMLGLPAFAFDDPKALVTAIYTPYQTPGAAAEQDPAQYYSERLKGLVSGQAAKAVDDLLSGEGGGAGTGDVAPALSFNPFIAAEHSLLMDLSIGEPVVMADKAIVTVSFHNFDQATLLSLSLVKDPNGWTVDDVASLGQGEHWLLSWLLQYDPFTVN
ncbi:MAG: hypothetical protein ABI398_09245 [Devosia sp.]